MSIRCSLGIHRFRKIMLIDWFGLVCERCGRTQEIQLPECVPPKPVPSDPQPRRNDELNALLRSATKKPARDGSGYQPFPHCDDEVGRPPREP